MATIIVWEKKEGIKPQLLINTCIDMFFLRMDELPLDKKKANNNGVGLRSTGLSRYKDHESNGWA